MATLRKLVRLICPKRFTEEEIIHNRQTELQFLVAERNGWANKGDEVCYVREL